MDDRRGKPAHTRTQFALDAATMLPRRLWFEYGSSREVTWEFKDVETATPLKPSDFRPPDPPAGWETQRVPLARNPLYRGAHPER